MLIKCVFLNNILSKHTSFEDLCISARMSRRFTRSCILNVLGTISKGKGHLKICHERSGGG